MKGQYFSFDAIIASVIFVLALVALLSYWHSVKSFLDFQGEELSKDAIRISNLLFTPPTPPSAGCAITKLGLSLAWDDKRVNSSVIECARDQEQGWLRERLGTPNNVSIRITNVADGTEVATLGGAVPSDAGDIVKIRRLATVVNEDGTNYPAAIDLSVYK